MMKKRSWYAASAIIYIRSKGGRQRKFSALENVYLVLAENAEGARSRAEVLGRAETPQGGIIWRKRPAELVFGWIRKVVLCAADPAIAGEPTVRRLRDGIEATYSWFSLSSRASLDALIEGRPTCVTYESE